MENPVNQTGNFNDQICCSKFPTEQSSHAERDMASLTICKTVALLKIKNLNSNLKTSQKSCIWYELLSGEVIKKGGTRREELGTKIGTRKSGEIDINLYMRGSSLNHRTGIGVKLE